MTNNHDRFWEIVQENAEEVKTWPDWMQAITINAKTIATGQFMDGGDDEQE